jgi:hypothetical protein|tara:strand:+ start:126 stop:653 length:528 start_codon:yes stop_codon:yes gene_type:complete
MATGVVDVFMVYQFLKRLATPFEKWDAFKEGVIDKEGNIILKKNRRNQNQKKSLKIFDVMILRLKRLLGKIPGGKTRLASYAAALWLIKEDWQSRSEEQLLSEGITDLDVDFLDYMREAKNKKFQEFIAQISNEEAPANAAGGGNVAGLGVNGPSDVKVSRNVKHTLRRRKKRRV